MTTPPIALSKLKKRCAQRRFAPHEEAQFQRFYADRAYPRARFGVIFGFFAWVSFCFWDWLGFPAEFPDLAAIRLVFAAPPIAWLGWFIARRPERFKASMQAWLSIAPVAVAVGVFLMMAVVRGRDANAAFQQFWPAFASLYVFIYAFLGLRLLPATAIGWASLALAWGAGWRNGIVVAEMGSALLQLAILNGLGMLICARQEIQERTLFKLRQHHRALARTARQGRLDAQEARDEALLESIRAESALLLAKSEREKLALAVAEKERFLSAAYHDLQQPLSVIGLYVRHAKQIADAAIQTDLAIIEEASLSIASMFQEVRGSWEIGGLRPDLETFRLCPLLDEIGHEFRAPAERKGLSFHLRKPRAEIWVRSNRSLLKRALSNLVGNAIKYTQQGGVLVAAVALRTKIRIDIRDSGVGIAEEFQQRIFEEYFQIAPPGRGRNQGFGLGLAIVHRIGQQLEGHALRVASKPGLGSRFSLTVPVGLVPGQEEATVSVDTATGKELAGRYVVVIEDEPMVLDGLVRMVTDAGGLAEGIDSIEAARHLFEARERCPDLLLTDFRLGHGQTGLDAVAALRECFEWAADVPVLFVTADLQAVSKLAGFQGIHAIHHKPINPDVLLAQIAALLALPRPLKGPVDCAAAS